MADPKCPECGTQGMDHIESKPSAQESKGGDPWFEVVYCDTCGYVYGVFAKHVMSHEVRLSMPSPRLPF